MTFVIEKSNKQKAISKNSRKTYHLSLITYHWRLRRQGYTLIELLVVLGILALTMGGITMFLTSTLKGTNKANAVAEVKQNGQAVLDSLERQIRGAVTVDNIGVNQKEIRLARDSGGYLFIACQNSANGRNSRIITAQTAQAAPPSLNANVWQSASNDDQKNGISIDYNSCQFRVYPAGFSPDGKPIPAVVSISFEANKTNERLDSSANSKFQTTISLRRY